MPLISSIYASVIILISVVILGCSTTANTLAPKSTTKSTDHSQTEKVFESIKSDPVKLRAFVSKFPKGADIHTHIDGAVYAESMIRWAAEDGKCVELATLTIIAPPCDARTGSPSVADSVSNEDTFNQLVDAFSVRNYKFGHRSGHSQFFSAFSRFRQANFGREGDMLDEVTRRAAEQNVYYLEIMQSWDMHRARAIAKSNNIDSQIAKLAIQSIAKFDIADARRRKLQNCNQANAEKACQVEVRFLAQVIRTFPRAKVRAQTKLAFKLIELDSRVVGINFVAPEDSPVTLQDHRWQMQLIAEEAARIPESQRNISLHAGELALGLVQPKYLGVHIRQAIEIAGAKRIGHGVDIIHDNQWRQLLTFMANNDIMVETNLTSNDVILQVKGNDHPFNLYREHGVPLSLSTDDEGLSRIDLSHEYQRAIETYNLKYDDIKQLARNALEYSFLDGKSVFKNDNSGKYLDACSSHGELQPTKPNCSDFLAHNAKARAQMRHELLLTEFESKYR